VDVSTGGSILVNLEEPEYFPFTETHNEGAVISLEAVPSFGYAFNGWEGDLSGTENHEFIVIDCNKQVTAVFKSDWRVIGTFAGSLFLVVFFLTILFIRRKEPPNTAQATGSEEITGEENTS
jgi:hypothetical protein